jgi:hypothetical protein
VAVGPGQGSQDQRDRYLHRDQQPDLERSARTEEHRTKVIATGALHGMGDHHD